MNDNVTPFPVKEPEAEHAYPAQTEDAVALQNLIGAVEQLDAGMKMALSLLADFDKRLRALELAQRKADRKNVPVIVNSQGHQVN